ncbi:hypothetical protein FXO38_14765 [Capsicum annuum]|nr:hypothetical protein FXO38_14765 [Capsicum annuum]KAF3666712.1 hypothetical protein FXO37_10392 [Capsicum annuum]
MASSDIFFGCGELGHRLRDCSIALQSALEQVLCPSNLTGLGGSPDVDTDLPLGIFLLDHDHARLSATAVMCLDHVALTVLTNYDHGERTAVTVTEADVVQPHGSASLRENLLLHHLPPLGSKVLVPNRIFEEVSSPESHGLGIGITSYEICPMHHEVAPRTFV